MQRAVNFTMYFFILAAIVLRMPSIMDNFRSEGKVLNAQKIYIANLDQSMSPIVFPVLGKKSVAIFWASWCAPCKIELNRLNSAIREKEIDARHVYAISTDENSSDMFKAMSERHYAFNVYLDKELNLSKSLKISSTPTVLFLDENNKVYWRTTGVSPTLIYKIKNFLN